MNEQNIEEKELSVRGHQDGSIFRLYYEVLAAEVVLTDYSR